MEGGEVGIAFGEGEGAEREAEGDVVQGVGRGGGRDAGGWDGDFEVWGHAVLFILVVQSEREWGWLFLLCRTWRFK